MHIVVCSYIKEEKKKDEGKTQDRDKRETPILMH